MLVMVLRGSSSSVCQVRAQYCELSHDRSAAGHNLQIKNSNRIVIRRRTRLKAELGNG